MATATSITRVLIATVASSPPISPSPTAWPSATGPRLVRRGLLSLAARRRERSPSLREITSPRIDATVSTPMPPISTPTRMRR